MGFHTFLMMKVFSVTVGKPKSKPNDSLENSKDGLSDNKKIQNREKRSGPDGMAEKSKSRDGSRDDRTHGSHRSLHSHSPFRKRHSPRKEVLSFSQIKVIKIEIQLLVRVSHPRLLIWCT